MLLRGDRLQTLGSFPIVCQNKKQKSIEHLSTPCIRYSTLSNCQIRIRDRSFLSTDESYYTELKNENEKKGKKKVIPEYYVTE